MTLSMTLSKTALPGPDDITRVELENGITVLVRPNFNSPSVVISGYLQLGALLDPPTQLGLADFTALALMRGTTSRDFQEIYQALESAGASLGFSGATHTTGFKGQALVEDLPLLLELLADAMRAPVFPGTQVARLRSQILTGLAIRAQDTRSMASLAFDQLVYRDHPYRNPEDGYPETIQAISREDLVNFHEQHYGPRGLVIAIVGGIEPARALDGVQASLGDWQKQAPAGLPELPELAALQTIVREKVDIPGKSQADIVMGAAGPPRQAPEFIAASIGNNILGQFGMMGRIGEVVREQAGLAYYAYSSLSGGTGPGPWVLAAGVDPENVEQASELMRQEVGRFVSEPVSEIELSDSKANYIGRLPLALESNSGVAGALLNLERYDLGLDYYQRYADLIRATQSEDVLAVAQQYLHPDRLAIAVAGP